MLGRLRSSFVAVAIAASLVIVVTRPAGASCGVDTYLGQICTFAFSYCPKGFLPADGAILPITENIALFSLIGTAYGGNGTTNFALPDLRDRTPVGTDGSAIGTSGGGTSTVSVRAATASGGVQAPDGPSPFVGVTRCIATTGIFPVRPGGGVSFGGTFVGEVMTFAGNFCTDGFALANGALQSIDQNPTLFSLLGTTYGGDGATTFGIPNLLGATVIGAGQGPDRPNVALGQQDGNTNLVRVDPAVAKGVQVPTAQSPFLNLTPCLSLNGAFPTFFQSDDTAGSGQEEGAREGRRPGIEGERGGR